MNRTLGLSLIALSLALAACGSDSRDPGITLMDGSTSDAASDAATDGGLMDAVVDTGPTVIDCTPSSTNFALSGVDCFPRCSMATGSTAAACADGACLSAALAADTTPAITVDFGGTPETVNCEMCYNVQSTSCIVDSCPTEFQTWATCASGSANPDVDCATEYQVVNDCITANQAIFQPCAQGRVGSCFAG